MPCWAWNQIWSLFVANSGKSPLLSLPSVTCEPNTCQGKPDTMTLLQSHIVTTTDAIIRDRLLRWSISEGRLGQFFRSIPSMLYRSKDLTTPRHNERKGKVIPGYLVLLKGWQWPMFLRSSTTPLVRAYIFTRAESLHQKFRLPMQGKHCVTLQKQHNAMKYLLL